MRILCTADLHLGRRSTRLPDSMAANPAFSCSATWDAMVSHAIAQQVDLVALAGDVVDEANRFYESLGPLERGVRRLADAGVQTVAVAGNHDYSVLPELARGLPAGHFTLLGAGGRWERKRFTARDGSAIDVDGWSFPAQYVSESPLASYPAVPSDKPILGMIHGDLDVAASRYAPLSRAGLAAHPIAMWLLGHIHRHDLIQTVGAPPILYPGSPHATDPGEAGAHGPWIVTLRAGEPVEPRPIAMSAVRYEAVDVDVSGAESDEDVRSFAWDAIQGALAEAQEAQIAPRVLSLRLRLVGRTALHHELMRNGHAIDTDLSFGSTVAYVERVTIGTHPGYDLVTLAEGNDVAGLVARFILELETNRSTTKELAVLIDKAENAAAKIRRASAYQTLAAQPSPDDESVPQVLARQASLLLHELLAQRESAA